MTDQELKKLKDDLLAEKETIETELERFAVKNPQVKGDYQSRFPKADQSDTLDEQAHSVTDYENERAVEQNLEVRLKEINETLQKIEAGAYGMCARCQSPIEAKRLEVMPAAKYCLNCAHEARLL